MAANRWSIRNYNAYLRDVRHKHGLSLNAARESYRQLRVLVNRPVRANDIVKHPRLTSRAIRTAKAVEIEIPTYGGIDIDYWIINYTEDWDDFEPITYEGMYETTH